MRFFDTKKTTVVNNPPLVQACSSWRGGYVIHSPSPQAYIDCATHYVSITYLSEDGYIHADLDNWHHLRSGSRSRLLKDFVRSLPHGHVGSLPMRFEGDFERYEIKTTPTIDLRTAEIRSLIWCLRLSHYLDSGRWTDRFADVLDIRLSLPHPSTRNSVPTCLPSQPSRVRDWIDIPSHGSLSSAI